MILPKHPKPLNPIFPMLAYFSLFLITRVFLLILTRAQYRHQKPDAFHEVLRKYRSIDAENCRTRPQHELFLPMEVLSHLPNVKDMYLNPLFPNRTNLAQIHNLAMNRALFYSYIFRKVEDPEEPGLLYYYVSHLADVASSSSINASAIYFDTNSSYPNWYRNFFNRTLPLFAPRAIRGDDFNDPLNPRRYSTLLMIDVQDLGAATQSSSNYTHPLYRINEWFTSWLPEKQKLTDYGKVTYLINIKYANGTERNVEFFGPPEVQADPGPVKWTRPYFDCGRSNKWLVAAVSPVADLYPRHTPWRHLQRHKYVAVVVMETDFYMVDINQCPLSDANPAPNLYAGTHRCKPTTECEPLQGYGLRRTGYQCRCRPGYRLPFYQHGPFQGELIERATEKEYERKFDCERIGNIRAVTQFDARDDISRRVTGGYFGPYGGQRPKSYLFGLDVSKEPEEYRYPFDPYISNHSQFYNAFGVPLGKDGRPIVYDENGNPIRAEVGVNPIVLENLPTWRFFNTHVYHGIPAYKGQNFRDPTVIRISREAPKTYCFSDGDSEYCSAKNPVTGRKDSINQPARSARQTLGFVPFSKKSGLLLKTLRALQYVTADNCASFDPNHLKLHETTSYGKERTFKNQMEIAVRLAHFISAFNQIANPKEVFFERTADPLFNEEQLFAEVLANVMGDMRILHSAIYFDTAKFPGRVYFAPAAYRTTRDSRSFYLEDETLYVKDRLRNYLAKDFFAELKQRWITEPSERLKRFSSRMRIRGDLKGSYSTKFDHYPVQYYAAETKDGFWTAPYYSCSGAMKEWVLTFAVPFFGLDSIGHSIEFQGVVTVTVPLAEIDLNQCDAAENVPNAFKNSHRCDKRSSYCVPILARRFELGAYKCECKPGFEYPSGEPVTHFDGQVMESEWEKKILGLPNKFDSLKCRLVGSAYKIQASFSMWYLLLIFYTYVSFR